MALLQQAATVAIQQQQQQQQQQHQKTVMASAAELAQSMMQSIAQRMVQHAAAQQQQQQQQHPGSNASMHHQAGLQHAGLQGHPAEHGGHRSHHGSSKRYSVHSLPDDVMGSEVKRRKSSQPMKKQWHCDTCEQTFPTKFEFDNHYQFCKLPPEGARPHCSVCDVSVPDMKSLGVHLRSQVHRIKVLRFDGQGHGQGQQRSVPNSQSEETDGDRSLGYFSARSDSSSVSAYSDPGQLSVSPSYSEGHEGRTQPTPLNLAADNNPEDTDPKRTDSRASAAQAQSPEPSAGAVPQQPGSNSTERGTPVHGTCHVSQSGLSPNGGEEEPEAEGEDGVGEGGPGEVMDFLLAHAKDLVMCKHCKIVYTDKTLYHLHMGLHNLNNQWQCNMCGKKCRNLHEFTSHVIHIKI